MLLNSNLPPLKHIYSKWIPPYITLFELIYTFLIFYLSTLNTLIMAPSYYSTLNTLLTLAYHSVILLLLTSFSGGLLYLVLPLFYPPFYIPTHPSLIVYSASYPLYIIHVYLPQLGLYKTYPIAVYTHPPP